MNISPEWRLRTRQQFDALFAEVDARFGARLNPSQQARPIPIVLPEGNKHEDRGHWSDPAFPDCRACNLARHVRARG